MLSLQFIVTSLIVIVVPGTGVIYTISVGVTKGRIAGVLAALGCTLGIVPHLVAALLGLTALIHTSALVFQFVKYAGVLYLLFVAWQLWRNAGAGMGDDKAPRSGRPVALMSRAVLINVLNPRLTLFFLAFIPQFLTGQARDAMGQTVLLSLVFMLLTLLVFVGYALLASRARSFLQGSTRARVWIQRGFALSIAGLAAQTALQE